MVLSRIFARPSFHFGVVLAAFLLAGCRRDAAPKAAPAAPPTQSVATAAPVTTPAAPAAPAGNAHAGETVILQAPTADADKTVVLQAPPAAPALMTTLPLLMPTDAPPAPANERAVPATVPLEDCVVLLTA